MPRVLTIVLCIAGIVFLWHVDHREFAIEIALLGGVAANDVFWYIKPKSLR